MRLLRELHASHPAAHRARGPHGAVASGARAPAARAPGPVRPGPALPVPGRRLTREASSPRG
ncbi:hypothetical protein STXM2123_688 [Streptomyces sp. F-3]|nr:hypothetical protein STXM2123_688 [Streptomyces sp. F-3]